LEPISLDPAGDGGPVAPVPGPCAGPVAGGDRFDDLADELVEVLGETGPGADVGGAVVLEVPEDDAGERDRGFGAAAGGADHPGLAGDEDVAAPGRDAPEG